MSFFVEAMQTLAKDGVGNGGIMTIGLVGQRDYPGHVLRTAQAMLRWDQRPSLWSHAFLVYDKIGATMSKSSVIAAKVTPSLGLMPNSKLSIRRVRPYAAISPTNAPITQS